MKRLYRTWIIGACLVLLMAGNGCVLVKPMMERRQARRALQAQALLLEATTDRYGETYFSNDPQASAAELDARIPKLRRALKLNPNLTEGHYWLGQYGLDRLSMMSPGPNDMAVMAACLSDLNAFIRSTPNDGKTYSLAYADVEKSRSPGALREKAWHSLIWNKCKLIPPAYGLATDSAITEAAATSNRLFEIARDQYSVCGTRFRVFVGKAEEIFSGSRASYSADVYAAAAGATTP